VTVSYAGALLLLGLLPATVFDAKGTGCLECPANLVLVRGDAGLFDTFNRYGLRIGLGWLVALGALILWRVGRSGRAVPAVAFTLVPAAAYLGLVAWDFQHALGRGILGTDPFDRRLWRYEAAALVVFAAAVGWGLLRERRARTSVARLVVELGALPRPGGVRDALANTLGDPELELAYRRSETDNYVDAFGRPLGVDPAPGRTVTPLLQGDTPVAVLVHDARLLDRPGLLQEVVAAARIAVENERLQAEVQAQLQELGASRARIVGAADAERRKLERDLHDGAQQRIVTLPLAIQLLRTQLGPTAPPETAKALQAADGELRTALEELRDVAHGLYPAVLTDEGVAAAVETLADRSPIPIEIGGLPSERYPLAVEIAAYFTIVEAVKGAAEASVSVEGNHGSLVVRVTSRMNPGQAEREVRLVAVGDRVGALGGSLEIGESTVRAEIPCG
jgi:signal transduction histidine kinase